MQQKLQPAVGPPNNEVNIMDIYRQIEELRCELNGVADLDERQEIQKQLNELKALLAEQEREP